MCCFPSWIKTEDEKCFWNIDALLDQHRIKYLDGVGHSAVEKVWKVRGQHVEGLEKIPAEFVKDIQAGRCVNMMRAEGFTRLTFLDGAVHSYDDQPAVVIKDVQEWYQNGKRHRDGDAPALVSGRAQKWFKKGRLHRDGELPAVVDVARKEKMWYKNGKRHRDNDLPAVEGKYEGKKWYVKGSLFREGGKPQVVEADGTQKWYFKNRLHKDGDLPAVVHPNGTVEFYVHGKRHRDNDLPAIVRADGSLRYYQNGKRVPAPKRMKKAVAPVVVVAKVVEAPKVQVEILDSPKTKMTFQDIQALEKYSNPALEAGEKVKKLEPVLN